MGFRGKDDDQWVETVWGHKWLIVTADHGKGDKLLLEELARLDAPCIFVPHLPPAMYQILLSQHSVKIGRALTKRRQRAAQFHISRNGDLRARQGPGFPKGPVLGGGKIRLPD